MIKKNRYNSINNIRLENLTANLKEAWKSISSAIVNFSLLLFEAFESKIYLEMYESWEEYIENELSIKRRQADYYRKVGEFYYKYEKIIKSEYLDTFTQKDFLKLIKITNKLPDEKSKIRIVKEIFKAKEPQIEIDKYC